MDEVQFVEDNLMNHPIYLKENMIFENCNKNNVVTDKENIENALKDYQHFMEI